MSEHQTVIITGPSGSGKTTLVDQLSMLYPETIHVPTGMSSRPMRKGESQGNPYYFVPPEVCLSTPAFNRTNYLGNEYCMPLRNFKDGWTNLVVLEVDGAKKLRNEYPIIYVNRSEIQLIEAIKKRNLPLSVEIGRLAQLEHELEMAKEFYHFVDNSGLLTQSITQTHQLIRKLTCLSTVIN